MAAINPKLIITTPRGSIFTTTTENGKVVAKLEWDPGFGKEMTAAMRKGQAFIDSEVLRLCDPMVPMDTGMYRKSGVLGTVIGSGTVQYIVPYAARLYYSPWMNFQGAPMRGAYFFERMKAAHRNSILGNVFSHMK